MKSTDVLKNVSIDDTLSLEQKPNLSTSGFKQLSFENIFLIRQYTVKNNVYRKRPCLNASNVQIKYVYSFCCF